MNNEVLIQAQIALFSGARGEARRIIAEMSADERHTSAVLWLDAQTQEDSEERLSRLKLLAIHTDDHYGQMAQAILEAEAEHLRKMSRIQFEMSRVLGVPIPLLVLGVLVLVAFSALLASQPQRDNTVITPTQTLAPTDAPVIDNSQPLNADLYTTRYGEGILQLVAVETDSRRIASRDSGETVTPVPGARFYALEAVFECRANICNAPPQARIVAQLADGQTVAPREDIKVLDEPSFTPIALGRTSSGWLIFEVPVVSRISALLIQPTLDEPAQTMVLDEVEP